MRLRRWSSLLALLLACFLVGPAAGKKKKKSPTKKPAKPAKVTKKEAAPPPPASLPVRTGPALKPPLPSAGPEEISFIGVGDIMMGSTYPDETGGRLPPNDGADLLAEVAPYLAAADLAFGNLEGPLLDGGETRKCPKKPSKTCYAFRVPARYGQYLKDAGFDFLSLANNHAGDFGVEGRESSRKILDELGIAHSGEIGDIAHLTIKGKKVDIIAFYTSAAGITYNLNDLEAAVKVVSESAASADIVIVSFHGGAEGASRQHVPVGSETFLKENRGDLRSFSRAVIDAGADLVVGHGPHVLRGMEVYKDRLIAYSLGNFATYGGFNLKGAAGLSVMLEVRLGLDGTFLGGQIHPAKQDWPGGPKLDPTGQAIAVLKALSEADFGASAVVIADDGTFAPPSVTVSKDEKP